jgi:hypothetical protein
MLDCLVDDIYDEVPASAVHRDSIAQDHSLFESLCSDDDDNGGCQMGRRDRKQPLPHSALFEAIKQKDWAQVLVFLRTGRWTTSLFQNKLANFEGPSPKHQCRTWEVDVDGVTRLPLHAAILAGAPPVVLKGLLDRYHGAIKHADSSDMLPLQLAMLRSDTSDATFLTLLKAWPAAFTKQ